MEETPIRFASIRRFSGLERVPNFISGNAQLKIPANTKCKILLDNAVNTTAYPKLFVEAGKGSKIKLRYADFGTKNYRTHVMSYQGVIPYLSKKYEYLT